MFLGDNPFGAANFTAASISWQRTDLTEEPDFSACHSLYFFRAYFPAVLQKDCALHTVRR